jgi:hypothetical protein
MQRRVVIPIFGGVSSFGRATAEHTLYFYATRASVTSAPILLVRRAGGRSVYNDELSRCVHVEPYRSFAGEVAYRDTS